MLTRLLKVVYKSKHVAVPCILVMSLVTLVFQMHNVISGHMTADPQSGVLAAVRHLRNLEPPVASVTTDNTNTSNSGHVSVPSSHGDIPDDEASMDICPIMYNSTTCLFEVNSQPSEKISKEPTGRVIRYIYKFRQGQILINGQKVYKWRTRGNLVLVHVDSACTVQDTLILPRPGEEGGSKKEEAFLQEYVEKLPNMAIILGVLYGDTTTYNKVLSDLGLQKYIVAQMVYRRGIVAFQLRKGYEGHSKTILNPKGGGNNTILQRHFEIGHAFAYNDEPIPYGTVVRNHSELLPGGQWSPPDCAPRWKIAIIIPFRQRENHLWTFLENMIRFLESQKLEFTIFVIEQAGDVLFNRASLMNIGYLEARKLGTFQCYAFHDVDQVPEDLANFYGCSDMPRHLVVTRSVTQYRLRMEYYFGGAIMMSPEHIEKINGFPNRIFGWGGEDDEIWARVLHVGMRVLRYPFEIARYRSLSHGLDKSNPHVQRKSADILHSISQYIKKDGLNSVNYEVLSIEKRAIYTHIIVHFPGPASMEQLRPIVNLTTTTVPPTPAPAADVEVDHYYNDLPQNKARRNTQQQLQLQQLQELIKQLPPLPQYFNQAYGDALPVPKPRAQANADQQNAALWKQQALQQIVQRIFPDQPNVDEAVSQKLLAQLIQQKLQPQQQSLNQAPIPPDALHLPQNDQKPQLNNEDPLPNAKEFEQPQIDDVQENIYQKHEQPFYANDMKRRIDNALKYDNDVH